MKTLLLTTTLLAVGTMQVKGGQLDFLRSDTSVFSFKPDGSLCLKNPPVRESSANPVTMHGLAIAKDSANKLWTDSDQVNISGNVISVSSELGLVFHNDSTGDSVLLTNAGNLEANTSAEANLTRVDMYLDNHVIETDMANNQTKEYCGFGDGKIEYDSSGATERFYLKDHLGSTRAVIDGSGTLVEAVSYDAYGAIIRSEIIAGVEEPTKEKFTGKEYDTNGFISGEIACGMQLDYFGRRYYDPEVGCWLSMDKARQFWNPYGYTTNPVMYVDADGNLFGIDDLLIGLAIGAIIGAYTGAAAANHTYDLTKWDYSSGKTWGYMAGGAVIGGVSGYAAVGIGTAVTGAAGIASGSGLVGSIAGGAVGGATAGGINYTGNYLITMAGGDRQWNTGGFFGGLGTSMGIGALVGGGVGALSYGLNPNGVNQGIIKWGYEHGNYQGAIDFASREYNILGGFQYCDNTWGPDVGGNTVSSSKSYLNQDAFKIGGNFDPSKLVQTLHHEAFMQMNGIFPASIAPDGFRNVIEQSAFFNDFNASGLGLSKGAADWSWQAYLRYLNP